MTTKPDLYHYYLPSVNGEGWAEIVIGSNGFFAAVSDYGNYGYAWRHIGKRTAREFISEIGADYLRGKLDSTKHFDADETEKAVRRTICQRRRGRDITEYDARKAWDALCIHDLIDFNDWSSAYGKVVDHDHELAHYSPSGMILGFVEKVLPRLQAILREELAAERATAPEASTR